MLSASRTALRAPRSVRGLATASLTKDSQVNQNLLNPTPSSTTKASRKC